MASFYACLPEALEEGQPFALAIISGVTGSSPQKEGAKALFFADGRIQGTLGGGCLEAEIQDRARRALASGQPATFELVLDQAFGWDDGLICGGRVSGLILPAAARAGALWLKLAEGGESVAWGVKRDFTIGLVAEGAGAEGWLYRETTRPPCALWIAGAGHLARAVAPLAAQLEFEVTVFDDRPSLVSKQYFPIDIKLRVDAWERLAREPLPARPVFGLIVTRGHQHDALVLRHWLRQPFAFLGMIGSQRKRRVMFEQFLAEGLATEPQLAQVACPVGLPIQAVSVAEIAVSILAQYVQQRAEKVLGRRSNS